MYIFSFASNFDRPFFFFLHVPSSSRTEAQKFFYIFDFFCFNFPWKVSIERKECSYCNHFFKLHFPSLAIRRSFFRFVHRLYWSLVKKQRDQLQYILIVSALSNFFLLLAGTQDDSSPVVFFSSLPFSSTFSPHFNIQWKMSIEERKYYSSIASTFSNLVPPTYEDRSFISSLSFRSSRSFLISFFAKKHASKDEKYIPIATSYSFFLSIERFFFKVAFSLK